MDHLSETKLNDMVGMMATALGEDATDSFWSKVTNAFDLMDIAENEIAAAQIRHPEKADELYKSFILLRPTEILQEVYNTLYLPHVYELLERVAYGVDTRLATKAEILAGMCGASFMASLSRSGTGLYLKLFHEIFPDYTGLDDHLETEGYYEDWDGQIDEMIAKEQHKLRQDWRKT